LAIAGALAPSDGEIRLKEQSILGRPTEAVARLGISLVPEGRNIFTQLTVEENLRLGTQMRRDKDRVEQDYAEMLAVFPILAERLLNPGGKLSGGEQQQLAIARALMTGARFILLDEPALGLAPIHRALENADRVYVLRQGRIELEGPSGELDEKAVERAYFGYD
jgi:branched-chain amino acid transport system ATP-binding protein